MRKSLKKINIRKIIKTVAFLGILSFVILISSRILRRKESYYYKDQFFHSDTQYDVLLFGSSHMHEGIDPVYLWENHGISSYNLASAGESIQMTYYVLKEALEHSKPRAVVIDSVKISEMEGSLGEGYAFVHESLDALPLNRNKIEAVRYASPFLNVDPLSFISDMYAYHGRYAELEKEDFTDTITYDRGAYIMTEVVKNEKADPGSYITDTRELKDGEGVKAYKKIIALCREKGVTPVLINIPANRDNYTKEEQIRTNSLMKYTEENGGKAVNLLPLLDEIGIDYDTDFGDSSHLNFLGVAKTADFLARYLKEEFDIPDHRGDSEYIDDWEKGIELWREQKTELLRKKKDAVSYIFLAEDDSRTIKVFMKEPEKTGTMYGLDFCLEKTGIIPEKASEEDIPGFDMRIEVRRSSDGAFLTEQYFNRDAGGNYVTVER